MYSVLNKKMRNSQPKRSGSQLQKSLSLIRESSNSNNFDSNKSNITNEIFLDAASKFLKE